LRTRIFYSSRPQSRATLVSHPGQGTAFQCAAIFPGKAADKPAAFFLNERDGISDAGYHLFTLSGLNCCNAKQEFRHAGS
jgi:hypothetical protein